MKLDPSDHDAIDEIVDKSVVRTLFNLGIDVSTPDKITEFRATMSDVTEWRRSMRAVKQAALTASIGTVAAGVLAAIWLGIQAMLGRGHG